MLSEFIRSFFAPPTPEQLVFMQVRSPKWPAVRANHLRIQPCCQVCMTTKDLEVHHIKPVHIPEFAHLELDPSNLWTLCRPHHYLFGHFMNWCSYNPYVCEDSADWARRIRMRPVVYIYGVN